MRLKGSRSQRAERGPHASSCAFLPLRIGFGRKQRLFLVSNSPYARFFPARRGGAGNVSDVLMRDLGKVWLCGTP